MASHDNAALAAKDSIDLKLAHAAAIADLIRGVDAGLLRDDTLADAGDALLRILDGIKDAAAVISKGAGLG